MSKYPEELDTDADLPFISDNLSELGADAINALRSAIFNIESEIGIGGSGTQDSIANRISVSLEPDGTINPAAIIGLGLVTLPIRNNEIADDASISESKLNLTFSTSSLNDLISDLINKFNVINGFISSSGIKLEPHIAGTDYNHLLSAIDVDNPAGIPNLSTHIVNDKNTLRNISNAFLALKDLNTDYVLHQKSNGSPENSTDPNTGTLPPDNFAHNASGIFLDTSRFTSIDQTNDSVQSFAEAVDQNSLSLLGSRTQNLFSNGISRNSRSSELNADGYGQNIIPLTLAKTFLLDGSANSPIDDITIGDDLIQFMPSIIDNTFDAKFSMIKPGDIIKIDYGTVVSNFIIESKKYSVNKDGFGTVIAKTFIVRINGKNLKETTTALVRIDRALFNQNKYGVLALASANNSNLASSQPDYPSLIVGNPRSANVLGIGFDPSKLDAAHYKLYLELYPNGDLTKAQVLPAIDITGNSGATIGNYTLDSVVNQFNSAIRKNGYNYRFIAYSYQGEFGVMLDPYNNSSFSVISGVVNSTGIYDQAASNTAYPNNIIGIDGSGNITQDPLGFGTGAANVASPAYASSFSTPEMALLPTQIFVPLKRNFYYVNGVETEKIKREVHTLLDTFGDGYWPATLSNRTILSDRIETTYSVPLDLSTSGLKVGKTLVIQPEGSSFSSIDNGRFIINSVVFDLTCDGYTTSSTLIKVYDSIHATGVSPFAPSTSTNFRIYFSDDSISFDSENVSDLTVSTPYKRFFEIFIDENAHTFSHERARFSLSDSSLVNLIKINFVNVSPKLRGYVSGNNKQILFTITSFDSSSGIFSGFLSSNGSLNIGSITSGKQGEIVRFYDETNIDFIELIFDINDSISSFTNKAVQIQLFLSLQLDEEMMLIGTCQVNDSTKKISYLKDHRQFGNTSEEQLSTSAIDFISAGEKYLHGNGVIRGFDIVSSSANVLTLTGGLALVNGKFINKNNSYVNVPALQEFYLSTIYTNIQWAICINDSGEYQTIPLLDFDISLDVPNNSTRLFQANNPINSQKYFIDASTYTNIVNNRKDLLILYVMTTTVS